MLEYQIDAPLKLVVLDASVDLAKKASEEAGAEVMVVMRSPDWALFRWLAMRDV